MTCRQARRARLIRNGLFGVELAARQKMGVRAAARKYTIRDGNLDWRIKFSPRRTWGKSCFELVGVAGFEPTTP
jgi:hypothetical protein